MESTDTLPNTDLTTSRRNTVRWRWWGALGGIILGVSDTWLANGLGISFEVNGQPATWLVAAHFGSSFTILGFLLGYTIEMRQRDRRRSAIIRSQMEAISAARARLVQSEKLAALGQLAATIAHEVRNPLGVIRSAAQGLAERLPPAEEEMRRACSFIITEIDRLSSVVTSLLAFARPPQLAPRPVGVNELVDHALLLARDDLEAKRVRVRRGNTGAIPPVRVDADLLSQVLLGLLANATEAVPAGGEVTLDARATDGAVEIEVADSGPGVPPDLRGRIFEPFFTTRSRGTGLGLAIARQIVEAHGGQIDVGDRPGGGARFSVRLPCTTTSLAA